MNSFQLDQVIRVEIRKVTCILQWHVALLMSWFTGKVFQSEVLVEFHNQAINYNNHG